MGKKIVFLDTETGGLDASEQSILSIGAVIYQDGQILDRFYRVINEGAKLVTTPGALKVNGFTVDKIELEGETPFVVVNSFRNWMAMNGLTKDVTIGGHNINFDIGFVKRLFQQAGLGVRYEDVFNHRSIDTMAIAGFLGYAGLMKHKNASLDNVLKELKLKREEVNHNALEDAELSAKAFTAMVGLVTRTSDETPYPDVI